LIVRAFSFPIVFIILVVILEKKEKSIGVSWVNVWRLFLVSYGCVVVYITLLSRKSEANTGLVLIPLKTYYDMFFGAGGFLDCVLQLIRHQKHAGIHMHMAWTGFSYMLLNVELFMPIGYILAKRKKGWGRVVLCTLLFSFSIETAQLIFKLGWFDIDDIINNVLGALIGFNLEHRIDKSPNRD
jgi:glycopeptide antibiotics resistance protein